MKATFGMAPSFFEVFPENALPGAWEAFKAMSAPNTAVPSKHKELIGLVVSAQIPCDYCVYYHTKTAKAQGATEEEIREAVATAAEIRHWSTILQGNQIELEDFKKEFQEMMEFMAEKKEEK